MAYTNNNQPKEIDVFNRFSRHNKLKVILIAIGMAIVGIVALYFFSKSLFTYTITIVPDGGTIYGDMMKQTVFEYKFLERTSPIEGLKRKGYYIDGFYKNSEKTKKFEFGKRLWRSQTVYIDWQPGYAVELFYVDGEDVSDRIKEDTTYYDETRLKNYHEWYVKPGTTYNVPLIYNDQIILNSAGDKNLNDHYDEQLLWYDNEEGTGDPIPLDTLSFTMDKNYKLYGRWFDTKESKFQVTDDGTLTRYLGRCAYIMLPDNIKAIKDIDVFMDGKWDENNVADGSGYSAFDKVLDSLKQVYFSENFEKLGRYSFNMCKTLEKVVFKGNKITTIPYKCFEECSSLREITIPISVTTIEQDAFNNDTLLKKINGMDNVTTIHDSAFGGCALETIDLPKVSYLGQRAFGGCPKLNSIYLGYMGLISTNVTSTDNNVFYGITGKIYVRAHLLDVYKVSGFWSSYANPNRYDVLPSGYFQTT